MAITISKSYRTVKNETSPAFARQSLLETLRRNGGNVEKTARELRCSKNTIYLALAKHQRHDLSDHPHTPKTDHPRKTRPDVIALIIKRRRETGFGKRRLHRYLYLWDDVVLPEATVGKILHDAHLARSKQRVRREYHRVKYRWDSIVPFEQSEIDTKEILDKQTLPVEVYRHVDESSCIPRYQWTFIEVVTRIRFLAWSYCRDWSCGQVFGKLVVWWLRLFGFQGRITMWSDGGTEFDAGQPGGFERSLEKVWKPLGVDRKIIRKGHPEDNPFVERSHQTDDYEFYIPYLLRIHREEEFLRWGGWWIKVGNLYRPHMGIGDLTPYQKLVSLGYQQPKEFCLFPPVILDHLVALDNFMEPLTTVQDHIDYDRNLPTLDRR
jgi:putative transposase